MVKSLNFLNKALGEGSGGRKGVLFLFGGGGQRVAVPVLENST